MVLSAYDSFTLGTARSRPYSDSASAIRDDEERRPDLELEGLGIIWKLVVRASQPYLRIVSVDGERMESGEYGSTGTDRARQQNAVSGLFGNECGG